MQQQQQQHNQWQQLCSELETQPVPSSPAHIMHVTPLPLLLLPVPGVAGNGQARNTQAITQIEARKLQES
jgi:hypothetical protein